jgi:hypothetical protein
MFKRFARAVRQSAPKDLQFKLELEAQYRRILLRGDAKLRQCLGA